MGLHWRSGLHYPNFAVRCLGGSGQAFYQRSPDQGIQTIYERPELCGRGTARRMLFWYLPGAVKGRGRIQFGFRILPLPYLRGLASRQRAAHNRLPRGKLTLGQNTNCDGDSSWVLLRVSERRSCFVIRSSRGLSGCKAAPQDGKILHVYMWKKILHLLYTALRVEPFTNVVYKSYGTFCELHEIFPGLSGASVPRRFLADTWRWKQSGYCKRRHCIEQKGKCSDDSSRIGASSNKRGLGLWSHKARASWSCCGHREHEILCDPSQVTRLELNGKEDAGASTLWGMLGFKETARMFLGKGYFKPCTYTSGAVLLSKSVRRYYKEYYPITRQTSGQFWAIHKGTSDFHELARSQDVVQAYSRRWASNVRQRGRVVFTYGRCGRWVWSNTGDRCDTWSPWNTRGSANLVTVSAFTIHYGTGVGGGSQGSGDTALPSTDPVEETGTSNLFTDPNTHRQHGGGADTDEHGVGISSADDGASAPALPANRNEDRNQSQLATQCPQPVRGPTVQDMEPARRHGSNFTLSLARSISGIAKSSTRVASQGISGGTGQNYTLSISRALERRTSTPVEPSAVLDPSDAPENLGGASNRGDHRASLAQTNLVRSLAAGLNRNGSGAAAASGFALAIQHRPKPRMGSRRRNSRGTVVAGIVARVDDAAPNTAGGAASVRLASHALAESTDRTQTSTWNKFTKFCESEGHQPLPADVSTILAYIGFLFEEDRVHATSLDGYLSAVRTRHTRAEHADPFNFPVVRDLILAFRRADDARGSFIDTRAALSADIILSIHNVGLHSPENSPMEYDAVITQLQYLLTWREGSIRTLQVGEVTLTRDGDGITLTARPRTLEGRPVRNAIPSGNFPQL